MNSPDRNLDACTDAVNGLSVEEAEKRLSEYGYNEVPEKKLNPVLKFAKKFWGLTSWMLELTVVMEWVFGKYLEAYVITALLVFNAIVSFIQEEKAGSAVDLLRQKLAVKARVKRGGAWALIPARELVPGDLVRLRAGDLIPADVKIVEGYVDVDQSAITGESLTVEKKIGDLLYSGSTVNKGEITGIVTATG
ncbi:MAG: HAD-IC family P-type ATPase, partial [Candidatus Bathyarchaeia archaeon]